MSLTPPEQEEAILKKVRAAEKKLRQIQDLKELRAAGKQLEEAQLTKLRNETALTREVADLKARVAELRAMPQQDTPLAARRQDTPFPRAQDCSPTSWPQPLDLDAQVPDATAYAAADKSAAAGSAAAAPSATAETADRPAELAMPTADWEAEADGKGGGEEAGEKGGETGSEEASIVNVGAR